MYNKAWQNERTIKVPIGLRSIKEAKGKRVLEVGNVLSNYHLLASYDVFDKYEAAPGIINEDALGLKPREPYDLFVSFSTMEHVGWDETPRELEKIIAAFKNLVSHTLRPGGTMMFTVLLGYITTLNKYKEENRLPPAKRLFLKRVSEKIVGRKPVMKRCAARFTKSRSGTQTR